MRVFKVFIFGLLCGWSIKFMIDRMYRGDEIEELRNENISLQQYVHSLEKQVRLKSPQSPAVTPMAVPSVPPAASAQTQASKDNLKSLKGVGATIEKRLNEAGIHTFTDLAQLTPDELQEKLGSTRRVSAKDLIAEAKKLARQK